MRSKLAFPSRLAAACVPLLLGACAGKEDAPPATKIDAQTAPVQAGQRTAALVREMSGSLSFLTDDGSVLAKLVRSAAPTASLEAGALVLAPLPQPLADMMKTTPAIKGRVQLSFMTEEEQLDDTANDVEVFLKERLLAEQNIETKTEEQIVYLLKGDPTCRPLPSRAAGMVGPAGPDAECAEQLAKLQVRVVARGDGDGVRLQILLGPDKHELSAFVIHSALVAWEMGLASAKKAIQFANDTLGEAQDPDLVALETFEGRWRASLAKLGEDHVKAELAILEKIRVAGTEPMGAFSTEATPALFSLTANGVAKTATLKLDARATEIGAPWDPRKTGAQNRDLTISIGGLHGETTISEAQEEVRFTGIGVGKSFVAVRGTHIFDLDLNPADGRKLDLVAKVIAGDRPRFEISPKLDLTAAFNLAAVAADFAEPPQGFLADDTLGLSLAGASPVVVQGRPAGAGGEEQAGLEIVAGTLTLTSQKKPASNVTVPAGQCLVVAEAPASGASPRAPAPPREAGRAGARSCSRRPPAAPSRWCACGPSACASKAGGTG
jgi:hypothetical protein